MTNHAELDNKLVNQFLSISLINKTMLQIVLYINIKERRNIAQRHRSTILFLYSGKISHIYPLYSFLCRVGRAAQIKSIILAHHLDFLQRLNLFGHLLAQTDAGISHRACQFFSVLLLGFNKTVYTIKSQTTVIANNTSAGIIIRKPGKEAQRTETADFFRVNIEHTIVMSFTVMSENVFHFRINLHAVFSTSLFHHFNTSERLDGTLQQLIRLKTNDKFIFFINISRLMR